jgi:putative transposase
VSPAQRRELVSFLRDEHQPSKRRACEIAGLRRSVHRYRSRRGPDLELRSEVRRLAAARPRFGCRRLGLLLRRGGLEVDHKRLWRVYLEEGLVVRRKKRKRKRLAAADRAARPELTGPNQRWSMDFMSDGLRDGRSLRLLNVVDDWSRFCPVVEVDLSLSAQRVIRALERTGELNGLGLSIVTDNGPEFTSRALNEWAHQRGIELIFIRPGKPIENAYAESFNGRVREECLNQHLFDDPQHARELCEAWRDDTTRSGRTRRSEDSLPASSWLSTRTGMPARVLRRCPRAPAARQPAPPVRTLQPTPEWEATTGPNLGAGSPIQKARLKDSRLAARNQVPTLRIKHDPLEVAENTL